MKQMSKLFVSISSFVLAVSVAACSSNVVQSTASITGKIDTSNANLIKAGDFTGVKNANGDVNFIADVGHGIKTGVSLSIKLNFNDGFNTKAFANGIRNKIKSDVQGMEFYLLNRNVPLGTGAGSGDGPSGNAFPVTTANNIAGPLFLDNTGGKITSLVAGTATTITFSNIAPNATNAGAGNTDIFVAAAAVDVATFAAIVSGANNITNKTLGAPGVAGTSQIFLSDASQTLVSRGWYATSSSGGDASNTGKINVTNGAVTATPYIIANSTNGALIVPLSLSDSKGASADSTITISDGSPTATGPTKVQ
ncbi:MAG: hypothetical protein AABZ74_14855 [Cyanobacteriota bacterium]|mgnify:CR=1 FL=1